MHSFIRLALVLVIGASAPLFVHADDWPMFGRDRTHNAVSPEKGAPTDWQIATRDDAKGTITKARNIKWSAKLGNQSLGGPVISRGLVFVGTNNESPRDPNDFRVVNGLKIPNDKSILMCFRESDGKFLWQYESPRMKVGDSWHFAMGSTPLIEGDRLWLFTNRSEALCLDIEPLRRATGKPIEIWKVDVRKEFGVFPNAPFCKLAFRPSVVSDSERVFVVTGNGVDEDGVTLPAPDAPSLVCLDKKTGKLIWKDNSPGQDIMHCQRSTPLVADIKGRMQVIVGQGDGWLRSFDANSGQLVWKCDLNPKGTKYDFGRGERNYVMATPVLHGGRIYIAPGQEIAHFGGPGHLYCIDPTGAGDVSLELVDPAGKEKPNPNSRVVWRYGGLDKDPKPKREFFFSRTITNATVQDGLVYATDIDGYAYCLDAKTGKLYWEHDLRSSSQTTPLWVDGKVYIANEDSEVLIFAHGKEKKLLAKIEMDLEIRAGPVFANGVLYVMTDSNLYAIEAGK